MLFRACLGKLGNAVLPVVLLVLLGSCRDTAPRAPKQEPDGVVRTVTVDTATRFQTMSGWEAVAQVGQDERGYATFQQAALFDAAVNDLGINRLRLELRAGAENSVDYFGELRSGKRVDWAAVRYATVNDNADPSVLNAAGFHFTELDDTVERILIPLRDRLLARGERLYVNLCYVAFESPQGYVHEEPAEYAELMLAAFQHLQDKYQLVPDAVEVILEPDNTPMWRGALIGRAIVATASRLNTAGFRPDFIGPSNTSMANAVRYFDEMIQVPGVSALLKEISYHRYGGVSDANLRKLSERAKQYGMRTAMLEHIGSDVDDLYKDVTLGHASGWEQFTLSYPASDNGAQYYTWENGAPVLSESARSLRQYFRYVRLGAVRVAASSESPTVRPVAFRNTNGGMAVILHLATGGDLVVRGLPSGSYGASLTGGDRTGQELGVFSTSANGEVHFSVPFPGVATLYRK
jgi:hypothetical protein